MTEETAWLDALSTACGYVQFVAKGDLDSARMVEKAEDRALLPALGLMGVQVMQCMVFPQVHGVNWDAPWMITDNKRRDCPAFEKAWFRREGFLIEQKGVAIPRTRRARRSRCRGMAMMIIVEFGSMARLNPECHQCVTPAKLNIGEVVQTSISRLRSNISGQVS